MTKLQLGVIGSAVVLFLVLYIGCETKPQDIQALEKSRALTAEVTNLEVLLQDARADLNPARRDPIMVLEQELAKAPDDSLRVTYLKRLSSEWFSAGHPAIAGAYAEQVAQLTGTEESWSVTATTFTICVQRTQDEKLRNYCTEQAVEAYENAISLNPANLAHKVNLAILYADNPPADNPMKGITILLDLNRENPESVLVLNSLGRLALRTGQYDRALERLEQALALDPDNAATVCLLSQAYEGLGQAPQAQQFAEKCRLLSEKSDEENN